MNGYQREELEYSDQAKTSELKLELFVIVGYWHWFSSQKKREQFTHLYIEYKSKAPTFQTSYSDFVKLSTCHSSCVRFSRFWTLFVGSKKSGLLYASAWSLEAYHTLSFVRMPFKLRFWLGLICSSTTLPIYYQNSPTTYTVGHMPPVYTSDIGSHWGSPCLGASTRKLRLHPSTMATCIL